MVYASRGFAFSETQLCTMAYDMAQAEGCKGFSPIRKRAGRNWLKKGFYKRNPEVRKKLAVNLSIQRAMAANPFNITKFFDQYEEYLAEWHLEYSPNRIWNVDECGVGDVPKQRSVVGITGERCFQTVCNEKAENTTVVTYISAGGLAVPPMVIFKAGRVKPEWREAAPSGYSVRSSASGYINADLFFDYAQKFVQFLKEKHIIEEWSKRRKVLVLLDLHKSHLFNLKFLKYMIANNIEVCSFPPHCTHIIQPLDDVPFANFKMQYQAKLLRINHLLKGQKMSKKTFFRLFVPTYTAAMTPEAIRKGFKNTGILPVNRETPKLRMTGPSIVYDKCKLVLLGERVGNFLNDKRVIPSG